MSKFQQTTAVMKFFRDLRDEQTLKQQRFEENQTNQRPADLSQTVFTYDIRTEPVLTLKDAADRNLLYNITQFLLDSRASLASRLEDQRVRQSLPDGTDFLRVCMDLEGVMSHFQVRRPMKHRRMKSTAAWSTSMTTMASPSSSRSGGGRTNHTTNNDEPTSPALSDQQRHSPFHASTGGVASPHSAAADDVDDGLATGIDQQTFVDVFTEVLRQEADRIVNHEGDILSSSVTTAMAAATTTTTAAVANEEGLSELQSAMTSLPSPTRQLPSRALMQGAAAGRRPSAAAAITFSGVFVTEEHVPSGAEDDSSPTHQISPSRSDQFAADDDAGPSRSRGDSLTTTQRRALSSKSLSLVGGRTERRMLMRLFDEMDVDSCGVVSWDSMVAYMTRVRVGGQDRIEEQREGQLCLTANDTGAPPIRVGSGKAATAASVQYIPELGAVLVMYERVLDSSHRGDDASAPDPKTKSAPRRANRPTNEDENSHVVANDSDAEGYKILELYATQDHRLMHRRLMPPSTSVVLYLPFVEEPSAAKKSSDQKSSASGGGGGFIGSFMSSGSFQAFRMQIQLARGTIDLIPSHNPIQLGGTHAPAYALFNKVTNLVYCASLHGTLFAYDPQALARPMRISSPQRMHHVFDEPITCMISSLDGTKVFVSCLFGGIALYQPIKDSVTHKFTATYGNRREACGIRTMEYIAESNILITAGPSSSIEVWMATPCRGVDPHICTLEHESDPHRHDIMFVWVDPTVSDRSVASLDKSGVMKLWDVSRGLVLGTFTVGDGLGYHVFAAAAATNVKGTLYYVGNSTRTHRCFLDNIVMRRKMVNPVAVARSNGVQHQRHCQLIRNEEQVLSAVDGTIITYDIKSGRMRQFFPNIFQDESKRISAVAAAAVSTAKKAFVATEDGDITTFCLLSGERRLILKPFRNGQYEVTGLVYFESQRILVAACKRRGAGSHKGAMQDPAIRVYNIPERDPPKGETEQELDFMCEVTVPGKRGVVALCERVHPTSTVCGLIVLWDTMGCMHQLSVEGSRVMLSTATTAEPLVAAPSTRTVADVQSEHPSATSQSTSTGGQLLSAAEINFASETTILTLLEDTAQDAMREVKCGVDLNPFPFVASSDSASHLHIWTAAPMDLFHVKSWDHFSPRKVVAGVNKAVVTALAFSPSPTQPRLIAADDHGCVSVWDLTRFLNAACETAVASFGDAVFRGSALAGGPLGRQQKMNGMPMPSFRIGEVGQLFGAIEIPLLHCFHICPIQAPAEPLVSIEVMTSRDAYCVGMALGSTRFVSMTGSVVGELQAEPKYMIEDPPKYFLDKISEVEEMKKPKKRTRAGELWAKLRQSVLGDGRVLMMGVKELLSRARNAVDLASKNQGDDDSDEDGPPLSPRSKVKIPRNEGDDSSDDDDGEGRSAASTTTSTRSSRAGRFPCYVTPCNTPTDVRNVLNTLRVPTDARHTECLIDPLRSDTDRHPALKALPNRGAHFDEVEDSLGQSMAASDFGRPAREELDPTMRVLLGVKKALETLAERVVMSKKQTPSRMTLATSAGGNVIVSSISLSKCYDPPPPLFAPSVFKALRRPEIALPPREDRPVVVAAWIEQWIRALHHHPREHPHDHTGMSLLHCWSSHLVPQHTMPLQTLHLPNLLALRYWKQVDEDENVPQLKLKGCVEIGPVVTPMPTHRRSTVVTSRTHVSVNDVVDQNNHSARSSQHYLSGRREGGLPLAEVAAEEVRPQMHVQAEGDNQREYPLAQPSSLAAGLHQRPLSALRRKLRDVPTSLADVMVVGSHTQSSASRDRSSVLPQPLPLLETLLHASAPLYPLQESPFLNPGRAPPALSPALFFPIGHDEHGECDGAADTSHDVSVARSAVHSRQQQQRPTSSSSVMSQRAVVVRPRSSTSSLVRAMSAVKHSTSMLHPNFIHSSIAVAVAPEALHDVVMQHRSWDGRDRVARTFASQFTHGISRQQGGGGGGGTGKLAKLRLSQHTGTVNDSGPAPEIDDTGGFMTRPVAMGHRSQSAGGATRARSSSVMSSKAGGSSVGDCNPTSKPPMARPASSSQDTRSRPLLSPPPCEVPTAGSEIPPTPMCEMAGASSLIMSSSGSPRPQSASHSSNDKRGASIEDRMSMVAKQRLLVAHVK
jgi:hypothetical protein